MTNRFRRCASGALVLGLAALVPLAAADAQVDLGAETPIARVYAGTVPAPGDAEFFVDANGQEGLRIDVVGKEVGIDDPFLEVYDAATGELLGSDDDSAGSLGSRIELFSETDRRLRLVVRSAMGADLPFDVELSVRASDVRPPRVEYVRIDGPAADGRFVSNGELFYVFEATAGQLIQIDLAAADDPWVELYRGFGPEAQSVGTDDDGGENRNARLVLRTAQQGTYAIAPRAWSGGDGAFQLTVRTLDAKLPLLELGFDQPMPFEVSQLTGLLGGQPFRLDPAAIAQIRAGKTLVQIGSGAGESVQFEIGFETSLGFAAVASQTVGTRSGSSLLELDLTGLAGAGTDLLERFRLLAGSPDAQGSFTLTLREKRVFEPPQPAPSPEAD